VNKDVFTFFAFGLYFLFAISSLTRVSVNNPVSPFLVSFLVFVFLAPVSGNCLIYSGKLQVLIGSMGSPLIGVPSVDSELLA